MDAEQEQEGDDSLGFISADVVMPRRCVAAAGIIFDVLLLLGYCCASILCCRCNVLNDEQLERETTVVAFNGVGGF